MTLVQTEPKKIYIRVDEWWDMNNWTLAQTSSALSGTWRVWAAMKPDGTRMYLSRDKYFYQCDLSTPFDISSYTQTSIFEWYQIEDIHFKPDGTKCYCLWWNPDASYIREYSLSTPWDMSTATQTAQVQKETWQRWLYITPDWTTVFISKASYDQWIRKYTLSTPWSLSTIGTATNYSGHGVSIRFGNNWKLMFIQEDNTSGNLTYKELSTPYDINSVVSTNTKSVWSLRACWLWFNDEGTICVMVWGWDNTNYITKYTL